MKKTIIAIAVLATAASVLAQGTLTFNNRVTGTVVSHVYGPEAGNPSLALTGNTSGETPAGTQVYTGAPLAGTGWSAELWAAAGASQPESALAAVAGSLTTFRTGSAAGFITSPGDVVVPGAAANTVATLQVRVWDNSGGTLTTWAAAELAWKSGAIAAGTSQLFNSSPLAGAPPAPATSFMDGLRSFNVYYIPEPSTFALLGLGALGMMIFRRK